MSRLARNLLYNLGGQAGLILLTLAATRLVFRRLGEDAFGLILLALTLNALLVSLLDLGVSATAVRVVASRRGGDAGVAAFVRTAGLFYWAGYLALAAAAWAAAPLIVAHWARPGHLGAGTGTAMLRLLLVASLSTLPRSLYLGVLRGLQRMGLTNAIELGASALQQGGTAAILALGGGPLQVAGWFAVAYGLALAAAGAGVARLEPARWLLPRYSHEAVLATWRFAAGLSGSSLLAVVHTQADRVVVSSALPVAAFGPYAFAAGVVGRVPALAAAAAQAAFPSLAASFHRGDRAGMLALYGKLQDLICYGAAVAAAAVAFGALPGFDYLFGHAAAARLGLPTALLCLGSFMNATMIGPYVAALAVGRPGFAVRLNVLALFTFLPAMVALVAVLGLTGAALAWIGYQVLAYACFVPPVCSRCLGISAWSWYGHVGRAAALVAATYGVAWPLAAVLGGTGAGPLLLGFAAATLAFVLAAYRMIGAPLRAHLRSLHLGPGLGP